MYHLSRVALFVPAQANAPPAFLYILSARSPTTGLDSGGRRVIYLGPTYLAAARIIELLLTGGWLDLVSSTGGLLLRGSAGGRVGGLRRGHWPPSAAAASAAFPAFDRTCGGAGGPLLLLLSSYSSSSGAWGQRGHGRRGEVGKKCGRDIHRGQRLARPSRGLVWVLVWAEVEGRLCWGRGVRGV